MKWRLLAYFSGAAEGAALVYWIGEVMRGGGVYDVVWVFVVLLGMAVTLAMLT